MVVKDKMNYYLYIFYAFISYLTFSLILKNISRLYGLSASFFKLLGISRKILHRAWVEHVLGPGFNF